MGRFGETEDYISVSELIQECTLSILVDDLAAIFKEHGSIVALSLISALVFVYTEAHVCPTGIR